jgi:hypothetical protein
VVVSKSRFLAGLQCHKRFWFEGHPGAAVADPPDPLSGYVQEQGHEVGRLARALFPAGVEILAGPLQPALALRQTQAAAAGASALFEAAAQGGGAFARADILHRQGPDGPWDLLEVKATGAKDESDLAEGQEDFLWDLAYQRHSFASAGFALDRARLALINKDYVRHGPVDPKGFFKIVDVSAAVADARPRCPACCGPWPKRARGPGRRRGRSAATAAGPTTALTGAFAGPRPRRTACSACAACRRRASWPSSMPVGPVFPSWGGRN